MDGSMKVEVQLRSGKLLISDAQTFDALREQANASEQTITDAELKDVIAEQLTPLVSMLTNMTNLTYFSIPVDGDTRYIHPDDISYIQLRTTGVFREVSDELE